MHFDHMQASEGGQEIQGKEIRRVSFEVSPNENTEISVKRDISSYIPIQGTVGLENDQSSTVNATVEAVYSCVASTFVQDYVLGDYILADKHNWLTSLKTMITTLVTNATTRVPSLGTSPTKGSSSLGTSSVKNAPTSGTSFRGDNEEQFVQDADQTGFIIRK